MRGGGHDDVSGTGLSPSQTGRPRPFPCAPCAPSAVSDRRTLAPYNTDQATLRSLALDGFGLFPFRSSLLRESRILISFPRLLRYFNSAGVRPIKGHRGFSSMGSPIRASTGVTPVDGSPWLFAVFRALLRTYGPRYPLRAVHVSNVRFPSRGERGFPPSPTVFTGMGGIRPSGFRRQSGGRFSFFLFPFRNGMDAVRLPEGIRKFQKNSHDVLPTRSSYRIFLVQMLKSRALSIRRTGRSRPVLSFGKKFER